MSGTSFAAPIVSAAVAMYRSYRPYEIEGFLNSCFDLGEEGVDSLFGHGAVDFGGLSSDVSWPKVTFDCLTTEIEPFTRSYSPYIPIQSYPQPTRNYQVFEGWYKDINLTEEVDYNRDIFSYDVTLYAKWANEDESIPFSYLVKPNETVEITGYTGHRRYITIPSFIQGNPVVSIASEAFKGEFELREVSLPSYLKSIGPRAFQHCSNLISINIPKSVTEIGDQAFEHCSRLGVVNIGSESSLVRIGDFAFSDTGLRGFTLPAATHYVNGSAFFGTINLKAFEVEGGNAYFLDRDGAILDINLSTIVAYPAGKKGEYSAPSSVHIVGPYARGYAQFTHFNFTGIDQLGVYSFAYTTHNSATVDVEVVPDYCFFKATFSQGITLGNRLRFLGDYSFAASSVGELIFPRNLVRIGDYAFFSAERLFLHFEQAESLIEIGASAFERSFILNPLRFEPVSLPTNLSKLGAFAFAGLGIASGVPKIEIILNPYLQEIGLGAFKSLYRIEIDLANLPGSLRSIGSLAFSENLFKGQATIPSGVTEIGPGAFALTDVSSFEVEPENPFFQAIDGVIHSKDGT
ncbi:MAG: leucine-rich repeat protein, partial [Bacilli bacterium]|nr:leucine-rich repeat protein [Bacilli bacterium]